MMIFINMIFSNLKAGTRKAWDWFNSPTISSMAKYIFVAILTVHFLILFFHQLPDNPLKHEFKYEFHGYVDPFFTQAWTLFAPNPINSNMSLLMRFEYENDDEENKTTNWIDITEPLIKDRTKNFWSPAQRVSKFTQSCMSNIQENNGLILKEINKTDSLKNDTVKAREFYLKAMSIAYGHKSIIQYSKHIAKNYFAQNKALNVKMQYRILNSQFPRFSKRKEDYNDLDNYEFTELTSEFIPITNISFR